MFLPACCLFPPLSQKFTFFLFIFLFWRYLCLFLSKFFLIVSGNPGQQPRGRAPQQRYPGYPQQQDSDGGYPNYPAAGYGY